MTWNLIQPRFQWDLKPESNQEISCRYHWLLKKKKQVKKLDQNCLGFETTQTSICLFNGDYDTPYKY